MINDYDDLIIMKNIFGLEIFPSILLEIFLQLDVRLDVLMFLILAVILADFIQLAVKIKNTFFFYVFFFLEWIAFSCVTNLFFIVIARVAK